MQVAENTAAADANFANDAYAYVIKQSSDLQVPLFAPGACDIGPAALCLSGCNV